MISIPAFREEGNLVFHYCRQTETISIPAFREEGDCANRELANGKNISIPAFREEGDGGFPGAGQAQRDFNPRLP